jgi:hypothetical protein
MITAHQILQGSSFRYFQKTTSNFKIGASMFIALMFSFVAASSLLL